MSPRDKVTKQRLDALLAGRGLTESREHARRLIMAGQVTVDGRLCRQQRLTRYGI